MKRTLIFLLGLIVGALLCMGFVAQPKQETQTSEEFRQEIIALSIQEAEEIKKELEPISEPIEEVNETPEPTDVIEDVPIEQEYFLNELEVLAHCVEAEAGNQDILGKRLVVDVVLNRVDSNQFPDDIISVITQEGQFSVVESGAIDLVEPSESTWEAIWLELERRTDNTVLFFSAGGWHSWCVPDYQHGAHYFGH